MDKIAKKLVQKLGPDAVMDAMHRMNEDSDALDEARKVRLPPNVTLADALNAFPAAVVRAIAREWDLSAHGSKKRIIRGIVGAMPKLVPKVLGDVFGDERVILKYVAEHNNSEIRKLQKTFSHMLADPDDDTDDRIALHSFVNVYVMLGLLVVGVRAVEGRDREIVTMTSDVKGLVAEHAGWDTKPDPDDGSDSGTDPAATASTRRARRREERMRKRAKWDRGAPAGGMPPGFSLVGVPAKLRNTLARAGSPTGGSIFKDDGRIEIAPDAIIDDPFEAMVAYAIAKYSNEFEAARGECRYNTKGMPDELIFKQHMTWFLMDRINPATGTTVLEEFVRETVTDKKVARMLMQATELFFDRFEVTEHIEGDLIVYGSITRKTYRLVTTGGPDFYPVGCRFEGRIHPYMNKYKPCGIVTRIL